MSLIKFQINIFFYFILISLANLYNFSFVLNFLLKQKIYDLNIHLVFVFVFCILFTKFILRIIILLFSLKASNVCLSKLNEQDKANILIKNHHHHHHHHTNINQTSNQTKAGTSNISNQNITNKKVTNRKPLQDQLEQLEQEEKEKLEQQEHRNRSYISTCLKSPKKSKRKHRKQINKRDECPFERSIDEYSLKIDNTFCNQHEIDEFYYDDEDIIPFHNCEYEKIIVVNKKFQSNTTNNTNKFLRLTKSLNNLTKANRKMMKTSRTESEIKNLTFTDDLQSASNTYNRSSRYSNHKKFRTSHRRSFHSLNQNDFSFYYSLTDVKYYNIDDEDNEEEEENERGLMNNNCSSYDNLKERSSVTSTRSSSLSLSYSSCNRRYSFSHYSTSSSTSNKSSCSSIDLNHKNNNHNNSLQKSITLPNAVLVDRIGSHSYSPRSSCPDLSKSLSDFYLQSPIAAKLKPTQTKSSSKEKCKKKKKYSKCLYFSSNTFSKRKNQSPINLIKRALKENNKHHTVHSMNPNNNYYYNYKRKLFLHNSIKCEMNGCEADLDDDNNEYDEQPSELMFHRPTQSNHLSFYDNVQMINHLENYHNHDCKQYSALMNANNAMSTSADNHIIKKWIEINTKSANSTSAYDTCSNLSNSNHSPNMLTSCESRSSSNSDPISTNICTTTSSSCSCSCSTSSRSACQSLSLSPKSSNSYAIHANMAITNDKDHNQIMRIQNDESVHTDVSEPHWDGYENSPYYSNLNQAERNKSIQAILPWDELFFELEPIEDTQIKVGFFFI
jgi:hypothetical protein